jgi:hypothetical protein
MDIWYILWSFGICIVWPFGTFFRVCTKLYQRKIWQPWISPDPVTLIIFKIRIGEFWPPFHFSSPKKCVSLRGEEKLGIRFIRQFRSTYYDCIYYTDAFEKSAKSCLQIDVTQEEKNTFTNKTPSCTKNVCADVHTHTMYVRSGESPGKTSVSIKSDS